MPNYDPDRIAEIEERVATGAEHQLRDVVTDLELLADLYMQADSHLPALETIQRLLDSPGARTLSPARRAAIESKAVECRLARGECQAALAHCREILGNEAAIASPAMAGRLRLQCSDALFRLGRLPEARAEAERALGLADEVQDPALAAQALSLLGSVSYREGDLAHARDQYEQSLVLHRRLGDELRVARRRINLALIHKNLCEWEPAIAHLEGALEIYRAKGRFADTGPALLNLGVVHQKSGSWVQAEECYRGAERVFLQTADQWSLAQVTIGLGNVARLQRRFVEAETLLLSALERARSAGVRREEVLALEFLGELENDRGHAEAAMGRYREALALAERIAPEGDLVVEIERRRAEALAALQRFDDAARACDRAARLAERTDDRLERAVSQRVAGEIAWGRGRREEALQLWSNAATMIADCRERLELGRVELALGRAHQDPRESRRHLYRAVGCFAELPTHFWLEQAEDELHRRIGGSTPAVARPANVIGRRARAPGLVACSNRMREVEQLARRAAATELSVLVLGETGTGKELIARTIHSQSSRVAAPFLAVNCGALRADLALSQLFGHRKGAFTGAHADGVGLVEAAHGGTLFLDEVGELPHDVQVTLLRFLESGEYLRLGETQVRRADVRLIAATNRELRSEMGEKLFRRDLLFRLNEIEIRLPALRERAEDIVPLGRHFLAFYGGLEGPQLGPDAESVLQTYRWPGNVRELENVMKRLGALHSGAGVLDAAELLPFLSSETPEPVHGATRADDDRQVIRTAWSRAGGNKSRLATLLGVSRKTLYARLKRLDLSLD